LWVSEMRPKRKSTRGRLCLRTRYVLRRAAIGTFRNPAEKSLFRLRSPRLAPSRKESLGSPARGRPLPPRIRQLKTSSPAIWGRRSSWTLSLDPSEPLDRLFGGPVPSSRPPMILDSEPARPDSTASTHSSALRADLNRLYRLKAVPPPRSVALISSTQNVDLHRASTEAAVRASSMDQTGSSDASRSIDPFFSEAAQVQPTPGTCPHRSADRAPADRAPAPSRTRWAPASSEPPDEVVSTHETAQTALTEANVNESMRTKGREARREHLDRLPPHIPPNPHIAGNLLSEMIHT
jgi:hypothetical protein